MPQCLCWHRMPTPTRPLRRGVGCMADSLRCHHQLRRCRQPTCWHATPCHRCVPCVMGLSTACACGVEKPGRHIPRMLVPPVPWLMASLMLPCCPRALVLFHMPARGHHHWCRAALCTPMAVVVPVAVVQVVQVVVVVVVVTTDVPDRARGLMKPPRVHSAGSRPHCSRLCTDSSSTNSTGNNNTSSSTNNRTRVGA